MPGPMAGSTRSAAMNPAWRETNSSMADRAYTHISRGEAVVGNGSVERRFSVFPGHTLSLRQVIAGRGYIEWIERPVPDWELAHDGQVIAGIPAVPDWSETTDDTGATLWAEWNAPDLLVRTWCMAFHGLPVLARGMSFHFRRTIPSVPTPRVVMERLAPRRDGAGALDDALQHRVAHGTWRGRKAAIELLGAGGVGLLLCACPEGRFEIFEPDPDLVRIGFDGVPGTPDPAGMPRAVFMIPYTGSPAAASSLFEEALRRWRARDIAARQRDREPTA